MALKFYKNLNLYKNSTGTNQVTAELDAAWSYGHWQYVRTYKTKNTKLKVFNNYSYSNTTNKHQNDTHNLFNFKGYITVNTRESLDKLSITEIREILIKDVIYNLKKRLKARKHKQRYRNNVIDAIRDIRKIDMGM